MRQQRWTSKNKSALLGNTMWVQAVGIKAMRTCRNPSAFNFFPAIARGSPLTW
jgi:hypothetical protein